MRPKLKRIHGDREGRSGRRIVSGFINRANTAYIQHHAEAASRAQGQRRRGHQPARGPSWPAFRARRCFCSPQQDVQIGGRAGNAQFQYTLQGDNLQDLLAWAPVVEQKLRDDPGTSGCEQRFAEPRARGRLGDRPRYGRPPGPDAADRSTTRCTTPLASGRSPRCTRESTSITS